MSVQYQTTPPRQLHPGPRFESDLVSPLWSPIDFLTGTLVNLVSDAKGCVVLWQTNSALAA